MTLGPLADWQKPNIKIQIASDLHLEFIRGRTPNLDEVLTPSAPVLALLGDIHVMGAPHHAEGYGTFLKECASRFERVLLLAGNHEFYTDPAAPVTYEEVIVHLRALAGRCGDHVSFLHNETAEISVEGSGGGRYSVLVYGSTLWTSIPRNQTVEGAPPDRAAESVEFKMMDFRKVYVKGEGVKPRLLEVRDTKNWHALAVEGLLAAAADATRRKLNLLVLTHHAPLMRGTSAPEHEGGALQSGFATDLSHVMAKERSICAWAYGHTHFNTDFVMSGVRVLSNQRGYDTTGLAGLAAGYDPSKVLSVHTAFLWSRPSPSKKRCALQ